MATEAIRSSVHAHARFRDTIDALRTRVCGRLELGLYARLTRYGLCRDLAVPIETPRARIPITVQPLQDRDLASLFACEDPRDKREAAWRLAFIAKGARRGFVAIDQRTRTPCYVQWLFGSNDNDFLKRLKGFPQLAADQALLENAYTPPAYRGLGIMSAAMALIAEHAPEVGGRHVLTFVGLDNVASLKGCQRAGFHPLILHESVRVGFGLIRRDRFATLPEADPRRSAKF